MSESVLNVNNLEVNIKSSKGTFPVLENISFNINKGEIVGLVGESGCGKSMTSLAIMGLLPNQAKWTKGEITLSSKQLQSLSPEEMRKLRGNQLAMIFQDPMTSLNPVLTIGYQLIESIKLHLQYPKAKAKTYAIDLLTKVGLSRADKLIYQYPHELSGGMRQRVMIAMALVCNPTLLIADEPTTALDVTIQAQIIDLLKELNKKEGTSILFISHDLGLVHDLCDKVFVMYAGEIVEQATVQELFDNPQHPYTKGLIQSLPLPEKKKERLYSIPGTVPGIHDRGQNCRFSSRCPHVTEHCTTHHPSQIQISKTHVVHCFLSEKGGTTSG
ncbi:ABC transporter ATP-binding protein [Pontibacillus litoralis]|uniref:Peptide ABC transporter ATP-binding protein n=1 Tax=Pontibacillus litoralis JSM 072002 TaxID=1385512 RepID=A0A0A5G623_9BACI|nr:ABC transporter ATP-binding protein [Pontibacillus litoralis]KGX86618.1 peptide ABC transporter ATP-binding protein [Pontibacillus litoralis JSM 072002]